jgi:predicted Zn-dependent peptidase
VSKAASEYAVPSEYDKMVASIGASGTNAFTSNDMTVYVNDIPSNAIDKWATLESERFSTLVLRLFHTELETVYEEFNRNQDDDIRWSNFAVDSMLMPNHRIRYTDHHRSRRAFEKSVYGQYSQLL